MIDFVERLAWRMSSGRDAVDAAYLKNKFEEEIGSLQLLSDQFQVCFIPDLKILNFVQNKLNTLDQQQQREKADYLDSLQRLHDKNAECLERLKVCHLKNRSIVFKTQKRTSQIKIQTLTQKT